jgi:hypothetical protein
VFFIANRDGKGLQISRCSDAQQASNVSRAPFAGRIRQPSKPRVLRVDDGVPARMDRITAIGNAVDPRVAERVLKLIRDC